MVSASTLVISLQARLPIETVPQTVPDFVPVPLIAFAVHKVRNRLRQGFHMGGRAWSEMTSVLADTIPGIRVVKAFAQEQREIERFRAGQRPRASRPTTA